MREVFGKRQRHHLYRHFDKDGKLLYVGVSLHALARLCGHRKNAKWFDEIAEVKIEQFRNREEALQAERLAVANEKPAHNIKLRCARLPRASKKPVIDQLRHRAAHSLGLSRGQRQEEREQCRRSSETKRAARRMVTMKQVLQLVLVGKTALMRMIKNKEFPGPHYISPNKPIWFLGEIELWQVERAEAAGKRPKGFSWSHTPSAGATMGAEAAASGAGPIRGLS